jgi:hypothetical protein
VRVFPSQILICRVLPLRRTEWVDLLGLFCILYHFLHFSCGVLIGSFFESGHDMLMNGKSMNDSILSRNNCEAPKGVTNFRVWFWRCD